MESLSSAAAEVMMLWRAVERLVERNDRSSWSEEWAAAASGEEEKGRGMAAFRGARVPRMGVGEYVERIGRYAGAAMSPSCFVVAFILLDRAAHRHPAHPVGSRTVHRLLLTSLLLASKLLDDAHHNNAFFARVGGVSNAELNRLELELLFLLDFELTVTPRVYESYYFHLQKEMLAPRTYEQRITTRSPMMTNGAIIDEGGDSETDKQKIKRSPMTNGAIIDEGGDSKTDKQKITRSPMTNGTIIDEDGDFTTNKQKITRSRMTNGTTDEDGNLKSSVRGRPRQWALSPPRRSVDCY